MTQDHGKRAERVTYRDVLLAEADAQADVAIKRLEEVAEGAHYHTDGGQVVRDEHGTLLHDPWPRLRALTEIRHWLEWKARLHGWYKRQETDIEVRSPDGAVLAVLHVTAAGGATVTVVEPEPGAGAKDGQEG